MNDLTTDTDTHSADAQRRAFAVYVFKEHGNSEDHSGRKRLSWLRDSVCNDLSAALTKAELVRSREGVTRVQVFEQLIDKDGAAHTGRIIRTLGQSRLKELFGFA